jgi:hypothetical protein
MPKSDFDGTDSQNHSNLNSPTITEIKQLIAQLQHSHHQRAKLVNLEFWALTITMDGFLTGFWSRFLANRRTALQEFIKNKRHNTTTKPKQSI